MWWGLLGLVVGEVAGALLAGAVSLVVGDGGEAVVTLAGELGLWTGMVGGCVLAVRRYGSGSLRRDLGIGARWVDLGWGPLVTVTGFVVTAVLGELFVGSRLAGSNTGLITGGSQGVVGKVVIAAVVSIGAPVVEEIFFRGLLRTALSARLGPVGGSLAQAGFFGLAHVNPANGLGNVEVVVVITAFGMALGMAAHLTRRLAAGMIGHSLYNLLVTVVAFTR